VKTWQEVDEDDSIGEGGDQAKVDQKKKTSGLVYKEERIFNYATPIVSFLRLGKLKLSKSLCINKTLFDKNF
jgi:hypothetical protein